MAHAQAKERLTIDDWEPPRPGKRRWLHERGTFVFAIEEYPLKETHVLSTLDRFVFAAD
jgi:hypothetical protein